MTLAQIEAMARIGLDGIGATVECHLSDDGVTLVSTKTVTVSPSLHLTNDCPTGAAAEAIDRFVAETKAL